MERERKEKPQAGSADNPLKKTYLSPEVQDWGSIQDLTQGAGFGTDFPKKGGSRPA